MDHCKHLWGFNTGADYGGYRPSEVFGLQEYCVHCGLPRELDEPWDTDGSLTNENGEGQEAENDRYAQRANPEEH